MDSGQWMDTTHIISRTPMEAAELMWPHARVFDYNTGSNRAASVKATGQGGGGGVSAAIWVNGRIWIHGRIQTRNSDLSLYRASCIEHLLLVQFVTPRRHEKRPVDFMRNFKCECCAKKRCVRANSGEFVPWRPTTYSEYIIVCCCCCCCCCCCLVGWLGKDGFTYASGIPVPGTWYQVPGSLRFRAVPGTWSRYLEVAKFLFTMISLAGDYLLVCCLPVQFSVCVRTWYYNI